MPHHGEPSRKRGACSDAGAGAASPSDVRDILLQISRDLAAARGRDELLQRITDAALRIAPCADKCVVHLLDDTGERLVPVVCSQPAPLPIGPGMPSNVGIAGRALREGRLINIPDTLKAPDFAPLSSGPELRCLLVAPLQVMERRLGTLSLSSREPAAFDPRDADLVGVLAAQASVAIEQDRLLQQALRERERSEAVITSVSEGIVVLDGEAQVQTMNPALHEMLELDPQACPLPCALAAMPRLGDLLPLPETIIGPFEAETALPSGRHLTVRVTSSRLYREEKACVVTVRDISYERQAAQARALFITQVSHELRTPLQHVLSFASLISDLDELPAEDQRNYVRHIEHETRRLGRLVNDLVVLSSIETGQFSMWLEPIDICALVANATARLVAYARLLDVELVLSCPPTSHMINSDAARIEQVLINLVDNALKHVAARGHVYVRVDTAGPDEVVISVEDNGPGIAKEELPFLFDSFYQATNSHSKRSGMGLGLHISQQIVHALSGRIWVESEVGRGSTFSFALPTAK